MDRTKTNNKSTRDLADVLAGVWPKEAGIMSDISNGGISSDGGEGRGSDGNATGNQEGAGYNGNRNGRYNIRDKSLNPFLHFMQHSQKSSGSTQYDSTYNDHNGGKASGYKDKKYDYNRKNTFQDKYPPYSPKIEPHQQQLPKTSPQKQSPPPTQIPPKELPSVPNTDLDIGTMVEVNILEDENLAGVIRWIGKFGGKTPYILIGVELTKKPLIKFNALQNLKYFECAANRAVYVRPDQCRKDKRSIEEASSYTLHFYSNKHKDIVCPIVPGSPISPRKICDQYVLKMYCGYFKGIQGHHNSSYLDATLFSMFAFTDVFDFLLLRGQRFDDIPNYTEVQRVLKEEIVNPLRKNNFVRADRVLKLHKIVDLLGPVMGYTTEEKDPEEFLNTLFVHVFKAEPLLRLNSGQNTFCYQLFVEKDDRLKLPTVQQLFDQSLAASNIKMKEMPSCLIIQMPRFGNKNKIYPMILPSHTLDVTDVIEDSPRQCCSCGDLAEVECKDCFDETDQVILELATFCIRCFDVQHKQRRHHKKPPTKIFIPETYKKMFNCNVPRLFMDLFAVICIESSHYVTFVKTASEYDAPWCFFDSMADRRGEPNGYNIPELISEPDISQLLTKDPNKTMAALDNLEVAKQTKRFFCDAYICMYRSSSMAMYR